MHYTRKYTTRVVGSFSLLLYYIMMVEARKSLKMYGLEPYHHGQIQETCIGIVENEFLIFKC